MVTGVTMIGQGQGYVTRGSYPELVQVLRQHGNDAAGEVFSRAAFSMAISNFDDHMRNHAAFWDGQTLELTPAYDLSPMARSGDTAALGTPFTRVGEKNAQFASLGAAAGEFGLTKAEATDRIERIRATINDHWQAAADFARLSEVDRRVLWGR